MEPQLMDSLRAAFTLAILFSTVSSENDLDLHFCGTWRHGRASLSLNYNLSPGCKGILISANESALSITGQITAKCRQAEDILLTQSGLYEENDSPFCLYWEPLLDQLKLQVREENFTLCKPRSMHGSCCTDLSHAANKPVAHYGYGIVNGSARSDLITDRIMTAYNFTGEPTDCKTLCDQAIQGSTKVNITGNAVMGSKSTGKVDHPCAHSSEVDMKGDFRGANITSPATSVTTEPTITVQIPPALKQAAKKTSKVECTFHKDNSLFQEGHNEIRIIDDVVEITVENEVIADLSEPIRIGFHHDNIPKTHLRKCVSWDTRKDPLHVNWLADGCETKAVGSKHTECLCNHLTYFSVLVQLKPRPVRHLLALTAITSLGCAVSVISCVALIIFLCRKSGRSKEQSIPIHLGLAVSLVFLNLLFFLTGVLANVGGQGVCLWVGAALHYSLLSSFTWMGIEIFHTFWLVHMVFSPSPKGHVWNLVGFVLPAVPIIILAAVGNIYGMREVVPSNDLNNPYRMCWMLDTPKALLAHYFTNLTLMAMLVSSGVVMLFLVYRKIRTRDEWRQNRVAFLSIWGLSCLFGTTWGLTFIEYGPLFDIVHFLSTILNSFQGFFLMLRFYMLDWMKKQAGGGSSLGSSSTGSTRQHMLQHQEKS